MSLSSRRSSSAPGKRSSYQGAAGSGTPDRRSNPTVLARKKRVMSQQREKVTLEWVLGLTCVNGNGLAVSGEAKCIAYPAGCVVVLYYPKPNRQTHLTNPARKTISCVAFSPGGKFLAAGECGHQPCIRVWDVASKTILSELQGHTFGVACVAFSPNSKHLVSVGYQHDMLVNLWNWKTSSKIAGNKVSNKVFGIDFSEDGSYFVTVGHRLVKYWYLKTQDKMRHAQPLQGRSAVLGEHLKESFMGVCCGKGGTASNTYCVTKSGKLCMFDEKRSLDQFIDLKVAGANCLAISEQFVFCGCINGTVRLFDPYTLEYMTTLPKPHPLGVRIGGFDLGEDVSAEGGGGEGEKMSSAGAEEVSKEYPDVVAVGIDTEQNRLSCVYNDHSLYTWDLRNIRHIGKLHSFLYHSAAIWDIDVYPDQSGGHHLPPNCFATCSTDGSVRFWSLDSTLPPQWKNMYSKELLKIIYTDKEVAGLKDQIRVPGSVSAAADTSKGIRTLKFRPNGEHLALGDRTGNLQVYDLQFMDKLREVVAHDSEILCVEFSNPELGHELMATASRDRLIHVFDAKDDYQFLRTLDEHSAAITSVKFATGKDDHFQLISCGADKSIIFRSLDNSAGTSPNFQLSSHIAGKATLFDMVIDVTGKFLATAGQDRNLTIFHIASVKKKLAYKAAGSDEGTLIRASLDPSGCFVATSSSDKSLCVFDFYSGENIAKLYGHSEVITGIKFSSDLKRVYSVSGDGCIFAWRLSTELSQAMCSRLVELGKEPPKLSPEPLLPYQAKRETYNVSSGPADTTEGSRDETDFRFSVSQLPPWAQKQMLSRPSVASKVEERVGGRVPPPSVNSPARVYGKWAERVADLGDEGHITLAYGSPMEEVLSPGGVEGEGTLSILNVEGVGGEEGVMEAGESDSDGEEGGEEEVVYPAGGKAVDEDAELFRVTSPVKVTLPEQTVDSSEKEDASPIDSPSSSSPVFLEGPSLAGEEQEIFMKANFESLSAADADKFFGTAHSLADTGSSRLSISTRFLSQSLERRRLIGWPQEPHHVIAFSAPQPRQAVVPADDSASPLLPQPPEMLPTLESGAGSSTTSPGVLELPGGSSGSPEVSLEPEKKRLCIEDPSDTDQASLLPSEQPLQKSTVLEEVDKAKRRLQELGWSLSARGDGSRKVIAMLPSSGTKASQESPSCEVGALSGERKTGEEVAMATQGEVVDVASEEMGSDKEIVAAAKEEGTVSAVKEKEIEAAVREGDIGGVVSEDLQEGDTSDTPMPLLGQTRKLVQDVTSSLQALLAHHTKVLEVAEAEGETEDTECSIVLLSQALTSVKEQSTSLAAKHRRRWKWSRQKAARENLVGHLGVDTMQATVNLDSSGVLSLGQTPVRLTTPQRGGATRREGCGDGDLAQTESSQTSDTAVTGAPHGSSGSMSDPAVVELLKQYSEQLLSVIREQMRSK